MDGNRIALATAKNFKSMQIHRIVNEEAMKVDDGDDSDNVQTLFLFNFKQAASVPWMIAVPNAANTLYVCWLSPSLTDYEIGHELLNHGIEFRTLLRLPCIAPSLPIPIVIPVDKTAEFLHA